MTVMTPQFEPYREPAGVTLFRTGMIALVVGGAIARPWIGGGGGLARWAITTLVALWPALGGHFVELAFLNWLRPRLPEHRSAHVVARLVIWLIGGTLLAIGMAATAWGVGAMLATPPTLYALRWLVMVGGVAFVGIELVVHLLLQVSGRPSFVNGRG